jgi:hypothetical protein
MDNKNKFLFVITKSTLDYPGFPDVLNQTHLEPLPRPRYFGRGHGHRGKGTPFRLYDDDGNLYWEGVMWDDGTEEQAFAPLEWAYGDGCTEIRIKTPKGRWERL